MEVKVHCDALERLLDENVEFHEQIGAVEDKLGSYESIQKFKTLYLDACEVLSKYVKHVQFARQRGIKIPNGSHDVTIAGVDRTIHFEFKGVCLPMLRPTIYSFGLFTTGRDGVVAQSGTQLVFHYREKCFGRKELGVDFRREISQEKALAEYRAPHKIHAYRNQRVAVFTRSENFPDIQNWQGVDTQTVLLPVYLAHLSHCLVDSATQINHVMSQRTQSITEVVSDPQLGE